MSKNLNLQLKSTRLNSFIVFINFQNSIVFKVLFFIFIFSCTQKATSQTTIVTGKKIHNEDYNKKTNTPTDIKNSILKTIHIDKSQDSTIPDNSIYFVNNEIIPLSELKAIDKEVIESINIKKKDTIIDKIKYSTQIFVTTKL